MKKVTKNLLVLWFLLFTLIQLNAQEQWELAKEKDGIRVFTRTNSQMSFKEFKAVTTIEAGVSEFLAVLLDVEGLKDWGHNITETKLLRKTDHMSQVYYAVASAPWPYKDRDGIYSNIFNWDKSSKRLRVKIDLLEEEYEDDRDFVRMDGYGFWEARALSEKELEVIFQMQIDPGGSIKSWMANIFVSDYPYDSMRGLREVIKDQKYQGKHFDLLSN